MQQKTIIELYSKLIRDVINHAAQRIDSRPFLEKVKVRLGFEKIEGWSILTSSLDLVDDTELAKNDYFRFGLIGPTRYENIGEMYIRFYGILNAIYLQKAAIVELSELFKLRNKDNHIKSLNALPVIRLRHIAGSHTVNFFDADSKRKRAYMISQHSLQEGKIAVMDDQNQFKHFDLPQLIRDFNHSAEIVIDLIAEKAIRSVCKTDKKGKTNFGNRLDRIQRTSKGDEFIDLPDGKTLVIHFKDR